jgi:hypothetical protein
MDMGVIYTFKSHYRQFLMQSLILNVEEANSSYALARSRIGESDVADNLGEASDNIAAISNLCRGKELSFDTKDFVQSNDHLATHYSSEPATALLAVRNTQNEDVEEEEGEAAARE